MADVKWIKLMVDMFNNRKIEQIETMPEGDGVIVIWLKLLCLAGNINEDGAVRFTEELPYTEAMLSTAFHRPLALVQMALNVFQKFGMIEIIDNIVHVKNWDKYQNVDRLTEIREYNRLAQRRRRETLKLSNVNDKSMTSQRCHETDIDTELDTEEEKKDTVWPTRDWREPKSPPPRKIIPPSLEYVKGYCLERKNNVNPESFIDHYTSNGWMVGKTKMVDWQAAVRNWEKSNTPKGQTRKLNFQDYDQGPQPDCSAETGIDLLAEGRALNGL